MAIGEGEQQRSLIRLVTVNPGQSEADLDRLLNDVVECADELEETAWMKQAGSESR